MTVTVTPSIAYIAFNNADNTFTFTPTYFDTATLFSLTLNLFDGLNSGTDILIVTIVN